MTIMYILVGLLIILNVFDVISTSIVLKDPNGEELNIIINSLSKRIGLWPTLLFVKTILFSLIYLFVWNVTALAIINAFYVIIAVNNANVLFKLRNESTK